MECESIPDSALIFRVFDTTPVSPCLYKSTFKISPCKISDFAKQFKWNESVAKTVQREIIKKLVKLLRGDLPNPENSKNKQEEFINEQAARLYEYATAKLKGLCKSELDSKKATLIQKKEILSRELDKYWQFFFPENVRFSEEPPVVIPVVIKALPKPPIPRPTQLTKSTRQMFPKRSSLDKEKAVEENTRSTARSRSLPDMKQYKKKLEIQESIEIAREVISERERDFIHLAKGQMIMLSRRLRHEKNPAAKPLPRSVLIVKTSEGYDFFVKNHINPHPGSTSRAPTSSGEFNKILSKAGGINKIDWVERSDGTRLVYRHKKNKKDENNFASRIQSGIEAALKDRPDLFVLPVAAAPAEKWLMSDSSPCKIVDGQVNPFLAENGAMFFGFNAHKNLCEKPPIPKEVVLILLSQLVDALAVMHERKLAHMDLKLENVMINVMRLLLMDFDTSVNLDAPVKRPYFDGREKKEWDETEMIATAGTDWVKSPEQCLGKDYEGHGNESPSARTILAMTDPVRKKEALQLLYSRMDCYSFVIIAHIMMTGKMPNYLHECFKSRFPIFAIINKKNTMDFDRLDTAGSKELAEQFSSLARERGFEEPLINLVKLGFSTDPSKRPTMAQFQSYFRNRAHKGG